MAMQEVTPEREPVAQGLNYIRSALDIIARMALDENTYDEVLAEEAMLWAIRNDVGWILMYIKKKQDDARKIRLVQ
jgi:hypothetical protein